MNDSLKHRELTQQIIGVFYDVYNELGYGFLESVYEEAMLMSLKEKGFRVQQQFPVPVWFKDKKIGNFEADLIVENSVVIELKAVRAIVDEHIAQLLNYLRATEIEVGLLLNFGQRPEFKRMAFDNQRKKMSTGKSMIDNLLEED